MTLQDRIISCRRRKAFHIVAMENEIGVQTRAMEKHREDGAHKQTNDNTDRVQAANPTTSIGTGGQETHDPAAGNPIEDKTEDEIIEEFMTVPLAKIGMYQTCIIPK